MRAFLVLLVMAAGFSNSARGAEAIAPGMALDTVKKTLHRHGYEVDNLTHGFAIASDKNTELDFCRIDDDITLVLAHDPRTGKVTSLGLYFFPDNPTPKRQRQVIVREALEMQFAEDGVYTIKLKRKPDKKKTTE